MYDPYHPIKPHFSQKTLRYNVYHRSSRSEVFLKKVFWKYAANLLENTHAKMRFHFGMGVLL